MCILNVPFHVFMDCVFIVIRICAKCMDNVLEENYQYIFFLFFFFKQVQVLYLFWK